MVTKKSRKSRLDSYFPNMMKAYKNLGKNNIFDEKKYALKHEFRATKSSSHGSLQFDSVFSDDGAGHNITLIKEDIAKCKFDLSSKEGTMELSSDKLVANVGMSILLQRDPGVVSLAGDYVTENIRSKTTLDASFQGEVSLRNESVIRSDGLSVGIDVEVNKTGAVDYNAVLNLDVDENTTYSVRTKDKLEVMDFTFAQRFGEGTEVAARLTWEPLRFSTELYLGGKYPCLGGQSQWLLGKDAAKVLYSRQLSETVKGEVSVNLPVRGYGVGITHGFRLSFQ